MSSTRFIYRSSIFFNKRQIESLFDLNPVLAMRWSTYIAGASNITPEELEHMTGNELSILQYATALRAKNELYTRASAIALAFGGKEGD